MQRAFCFFLSTFQRESIPGDIRLMNSLEGGFRIYTSHSPASVVRFVRKTLPREELSLVSLSFSPFLPWGLASLSRQILFAVVRAPQGYLSWSTGCLQPNMQIPLPISETYVP